MATEASASISVTFDSHEIESFNMIKAGTIKSNQHGIIVCNTSGDCLFCSTYDYDDAVRYVIVRGMLHGEISSDGLRG